MGWALALRPHGSLAAFALVLAAVRAEQSLEARKLRALAAACKPTLPWMLLQLCREVYTAGKPGEVVEITYSAMILHAGAPNARQGRGGGGRG